MQIILSISLWGLNWSTCASMGIMVLWSLTYLSDLCVNGEYIFIEKEEWHQLCNKHETPLKVIEIQYGDKCIEEDIERVKALSSM